MAVAGAAQADRQLAAHQPEAAAGPFWAAVWSSKPGAALGGSRPQARRANARRRRLKPLRAEQSSQRGPSDPSTARDDCSRDQWSRPRCPRRRHRSALPETQPQRVL